ncbi:ABC transporter permease [Blautia hominis]|uniref:ABC transporter permease n=1 Tax=Blautia hominis TaxID=2025493 RepID=A0ABQ0BBV1_9FIRM
MLFKLSVKNIRKSLKDYAIYFMTLILGVAIFYIFNSLDSQQAMTDLTSSKKEIISLMITMLSGVSVFVSCILAFLIVYANNFLIKRRKKEFGVYMTLGMGKGQISRILVGETFLIGLLSLAVGLFIGVLGAQFMSVLVVKMFEVDMESYVFVFSKAAFFKTILYFGIMYLAVLVFNTVSISKCSLIDLLSAGKKAEQIKMKKPAVCMVLFLFSVALLGVLYYLVACIPTKLDTGTYGIIIALGCLATFLFFWSLSGFLLHMMQRNRKYYLKDLNAFVLRQINSKVNTTVVAMTIICIMLFMTITVLSSGLGINHSFRESLMELTPVDVNVEYMPPSGESAGTPVSDKLQDAGFDLHVLQEDYVEMGIYSTGQLTMGLTLGENMSEVSKNFMFLNAELEEDMIRLSDYNRLAKLYGNPQYDLKDDEYLVLCNMDDVKIQRDKMLKKGEKIQLDGISYSPKYGECQDGFLQMMTNRINPGIYVLPDHAVKEEWRNRGFLAADYARQDKKGVEDADAKINAIPRELGIYSNTRTDIVSASMGLSTIITFVAIYLGIIFLISGAAIVALKELSESSDNRDRYEVLRKIGADERMINRSLFKQIGIFFLMPLSLAVVHSIFGLQFVRVMMITMGEVNRFGSILTTALILLVIYGGYFLTTYLGSKRIIQGK